MSVTSLEDLRGRHGVTIGQSLTNAWNERNGKPTKRSKEYPNPEFYSLRYSFKPESIDNDGLGSLRPKAGDGHAYELERPGTKGGVHRFSAVEQRSKDWECILLWDPETRTLKLERLESTLNLTFEGQSSASTSTSNRKNKAAAAPGKSKQEDEMDEITALIIDELDAEGERDNDFDLEALLGDSPKRREEEAESDIEAEVLPPPPPVVVQQPKGKSAAKPPKAKEPKAPPKPKPAPKPKASSAAASKKGKEKEPTKAKAKEKEKERFDLAVENTEEEVLSFGHRPSPVKPSYQSDPATNSGWAFPSLPSQAPPAPVRHAQPTPSDLLQPPSSSISHIQYESDSDPEVMQTGNNGGGDGEVLNDVDEDLFAHEMELVLGGEDNNDDEDDDLEPVPIGTEPTTNSRLLTLNELVGNNDNGTLDNSDDDDDDDDDTSSDDTDDD